LYHEHNDKSFLIHPVYWKKRT